ncbi:mediator of RNA polymerase II transcription subunit 12, partial [Mytilus galloprovincialis]
MQMQMSAYPSQEFRPLKKPRLGPPDVYPQEPKQKEDELTEKSVKHGFNNTQMYNMDEYGSARRENISEEKFGSEFIALLNKKKEFNTFQDTSKKKQQPSKDNFWP